MSTKISHSGVVDSVEGDCVKVRIVQTSACAACKVAGYCNAAESKEKIVDVFCGDTAKNYNVGQPVTVSTSGSVAARALLWGFGMPFLVLVTVLFVVLQLTHSEGLAAVSAILALLPYYGLLWLLRDRMREQLSFAIEQ
ncbi:MAG: SoxR reducing system RseC family protein [Prevotella sp.]|nr:SoxR reducing system RseC family protein [Prevotella sp.]